MKKKTILIALCSILILAVAVVAIIKFTGFANKPDGSTDTMELSEVSGYVLEKGYTQEQIEEKLKGEFRNDIIASWGEPDGMLSGFWGDMWYLDDKDDMRITLYYDNEGYVMGVRIISTVEENKLIYGETGTDDIPLDKEDMVIEQVGVLTEPPEMTVVCNGKQITALRGTYSWEYQNEDGTSTAIEADSMHPLESQEFMPDLPLAYSYQSSVSAFRAYLQFVVAPDEIDVVYWGTDCWGNASADKNALEVKTIEIDFADGSWGVDHAIDLIDGNYIYEVVARWNNSKEYSGVAHYSFYTVMGNYEQIPVGE